MGKIGGRALAATSMMNDGGVIFADGIEHDFLQFDWRQQVILALAAQTLKLIG